MTASGKSKSIHRHQHFVEPLMERPGYTQKPMFGAIGCYLDGKMIMVLADREDPWRGLLIATERDQHKAIQADFPKLQPHPDVVKWLYLPETEDHFETIGNKIIQLIGEGDPRFGIIPKPKKKMHKNRDY
ncbi:hypothetical protein [Rubellicoccus peritrichatus]|uniref:TfoX N-terminal domain-containing protein n=1 Tax=Rubellicoccus peritrichatus TaxID=3080537 RepID=A0AAQ3LD92_9BACT|nr:hypothetical protein [Puniceicoccus sp. CR14]WOO41740.1 hypothetical protein RZN69_01470 [Puniceicoccus sp. CR14]